MRRRGTAVAIVLAVLAWLALASTESRSDAAPIERAEARDPVRHTSSQWRHARDRHRDEGDHEDEDEDEDQEVAELVRASSSSTSAHEGPRWAPSPVSDTPASIRIENTCDDAITLLWIGYDGAEREYTRIRPGHFVEQPTFEGHEWLVRSSAGEVVARFAGTDGDVLVPWADGTSSRAHASVREEDPPASCAICSPRSTTAAAFTVESHCAIPVQLVWRDFRGATRDYGAIAPGAVVTQHSFVGHRWEVIDDEGTTVARYVVDEDGEHVVACP